MEILPPKTIEACRKVREGFESRAFLNVWEGAVRSSKTVFALMAFAKYILESPERSFLLSGRTIKTIEKNAILDDFGLLNFLPGSEYHKVGESRAITLSVGGRVKTITVVGAADIRAYMQIRGNSYGGWFADEINMHDHEFVAEALRRTAASNDRRHYWTLNPDTPQHWIYTEYLDRYASMTDDELVQLGGYRHWLYTPKDNPEMTPAKIQSLEMQYPKGTYLYTRYVLGLRSVAEGLVYPRIEESYFSDFDRSKVLCRYCAIDFGTTHATVMYLGGPYDGDRHDWRIAYEYYDEMSDKTTSDYLHDFFALCSEAGVDPYTVRIAIDPAAGPLKKEFQKANLQAFNARNPVLDGITYTRNLLYNGYLRFHSSCKKAKLGMSTYVWDETAASHGEDKPLKVRDDAVDAFRYFAYTHVYQAMGG